MSIHDAPRHDDTTLAVVKQQVAEILANLSQRPGGWVPDDGIEGPDCGSLVHHRAGRCDCNVSRAERDHGADDTADRDWASRWGA